MKGTTKKIIGAITIAGLLASPLAGISAETQDEPYLVYKDTIIYKIVKDGRDIFVNQKGEEVDEKDVEALEKRLAEEEQKAAEEKAKEAAKEDKKAGKAADDSKANKDSEKNQGKEADKKAAKAEAQKNDKNGDSAKTDKKADQAAPAAAELEAAGQEVASSPAAVVEEGQADAPASLVLNQKEKENTVDEVALVPLPTDQDDTTLQQPMVTSNEAFIAANPLYSVDASTGYYKGSVMSWKDFSPSSGRLQLKKEAEKMLGWHYSQPQRMTDGYRDCSSFVHTALMDAGFMPRESWAFTTYTLPNYTEYLEQISWEDIKPGDIILGDGHVAFYWGEDASGAPVTLESCGTFGVVYGYMEANGWNFDYTSVWRVKGIDQDVAGSDLVDAIA